MRYKPHGVSSFHLIAIKIKGVTVPRPGIHLTSIVLLQMSSHSREACGLREVNKLSLGLR